MHDAALSRPSSVPADREDRFAPLTLDLTQIPLVLSCQQIDGERNEDGELIDERFWKIEEEVQDAAGTRRRIRVVGDRREGLLYGHDWDLLLATLHLADKRGYDDGRFEDVSIRAYADVLDMEYGGSFGNRVLGFLKRAAAIRIHWNVDAEGTHELAEQLRLGAPDLFPDMPGRQTPGAREDAVLGLLSYKTSEVTNEQHRTSVWIDHLEVNSFLMDRTVTGKLALIDLDSFLSLTSPTAKSLYVKLAGHAARASSLRETSNWSFRLNELWRHCRIAPHHRPARARDIVMSAASQLQEQDVLSDADVVQKARGEYAFALHPGGRLIEAYHRQGIGLLDPPEVRSAISRLSKFGIEGSSARKLLRTNPQRLLEVVDFAEWLQEHDPGYVKKSWSGLIVNAVRADWALTANEKYRRYLEAENEQPSLPASKQKEASVSEEPAVEGAVADKPTTEVDAGRSTPTCQAEPADPGAARLWEEVLEAGLLESVPGSLRVGLRHLVGHERREGTLVCLADNDLMHEWARRAENEVERFLSEHTDGEVTGWSVQLVSGDGPS